ncbi:MAG TPA: hypothetical protein VGR35_22540 [Tepidisphaeraceae bacterium]|nr:hypothetical protein [Tepidisphaeraceae bacterium]
MNDLPNILAQEGSDLPKYIFGLIFFVIWVLSAFVSWINKRQQEAKRQRLREELERASRYGRTPAPEPPPTPPRPAPQRISEGIAQRFPEVMLPPAPPPMRQQPPPQQRRPIPPKPQQSVRRPMKQPKPRRPVLTALPPLPALEEVAPTTPYVNITQPAARAKPPTVDATGIKQWMTPATLRHQFILTEILQPPLAMRPDRHGPA